VFAVIDPPTVPPVPLVFDVKVRVVVGTATPALTLRFAVVRAL
jgi:hypothetical protein